MFLADKASDDGSGIWCSKGTIQRHTELGASTVKRSIKDFLNEGILVETGQRRKCKNGFTVVYCIVLTKVRLLELVDEPVFETGVAPNLVPYEPGSGSTEKLQERSPRTPNNPKTILKPPSREELVRFTEILAEYPEDRIRNEGTCIDEIAKVIASGVSADELLACVQSYAAASNGFTRSKVSFSDNWIKNRRWENYLPDIRDAISAGEDQANKSLAMLAGWVRQKHPLCKHITPLQIDALLASGLVSEEELRAVGLSK